MIFSLPIRLYCLKTMKKVARTSVSQYVEEITSQKSIDYDAANVTKEENTSLKELNSIQKYLKHYITTTKKLMPKKNKTIHEVEEHEHEHEHQQSKEVKELNNQKEFCRLAILQIQAVAITRMGMRNYDNMENQDVIMEDEIVNKCKVYGIFDGHGQHGRVIALAAKNILQNLLQKYSEEIKHENGMFSIQMIVKKALNQTNSYILHYKSEEAQLSGTTALITVLTPTTIHVFNIGNSRAVLGKYNKHMQTVQPFQITHDHTLERFDERLRIKQSGGVVEHFKNEQGEAIGPNRIWAKDQKYPGVTITRTLGLSCATKLGLISQPEISSYRVRNTFRFIVMGSDGLWTVEENKEVIDILGKSTPESLANYANSLIFEVLKRWRSREELMDDVSLIVIPLHFQ